MPTVTNLREPHLSTGHLFISDVIAYGSNHTTHGRVTAHDVQKKKIREKARRSDRERERLERQRV